MRETHLRGKNSYKSLREKKKRENHCDFRIPTGEHFLRLQLKIRSPLDWAKFWIIGSTRVII